MSKFQYIFQLLAAILAIALLAVGSNPALSVARAKPPWVGKTLEGQPCKGTQIPFGPYDYLQRFNFLPELMVVEESHFTEGVENLTKGETTEPMGDIDYTLKAWPNHHGALNSAMKFRLKHRKWPESSKGMRAECYLQRAMKFSPNDGIPPLLYGILLHRFKQYKEAIPPYRRAVQLMPLDIVAKYNLGLALAELKRWGEAKTIAEEVYAAKFPLPGLKKKLIAAGHWKPEPGAPGKIGAKPAPAAGSPAAGEGDKDTAAEINKAAKKNQKADAPEESSTAATTTDESEPTDDDTGNIDKEESVDTTDIQKELDASFEEQRAVDDSVPLVDYGDTGEAAPEQGDSESFIGSDDISN